MRVVRIDDVIVARSDAAVAEPLPEGLAKSRYSEPIILREDLVLVDGLRRLLWHKQQGSQTVKAIVVTEFVEALAVLEAQNQDRHAPITSRRLWNIISVLQLMRNRWGRSKQGGWERDENGHVMRDQDGRVIRNERAAPGVYKSPERSSRARYQKALSVSEHMMQATTFLYRRADQGDVLAQALVAQIDSGQLTTVTAYRDYQRPNNLGGDVTDQAEQRRLLERGTLGLAAQVATMQRLGHPLKVSTEDLAKAVDGIMEARSQLTTLLNGFRKILKERNG